MKNLITCLFLLIIGIRGINAQIVYTDVNPDATVNSWDAYSINLNETPMRRVIIWFHPWSPNQVVIQNLLDDCEILWDANGRYPAKLNVGDVIGNTGTGTWSIADYDTLNVGGSFGNWIGGVTDHYIGFRYKTTGGWYYGWIRMDVEQTPTQFTIKDWAYQSQEGQSIQAGETGATGISESKKESPVIVVNEHIIHFYNLEQNRQHPVMIYDGKGQLLVDTSVNSNGTIDLNGYVPGMYIVALTSYGKKFKIILSN